MDIDKKFDKLFKLVKSNTDTLLKLKELLTNLQKNKTQWMKK